MDTTAGQIANYTGNAGAALGSSAGGNSGATLIYGETDAPETRQAFDEIALHSFQKNKAIYDRKIKERDEIFEAVKSEKLDLGRLLETDRNYILKNFRDPIYKLLMENPNINKDDKKYQEFMNLMDKFREAKAYGATRLATISGMDAEIAKETDPEKRARMQAHRDRMYGQDIYKEVTPYQQVLDFGDQTFVKPEIKESPTEKLVGNEIISTNHRYTPVEEFTKRIYSNYIDSPNKTLKNEMDQFAASFHALPDDLKASKLTQLNDKIAQVNEDNGLKPGDKDYIKPIKGQYYEGRFVVTATAPELVLAESLVRNYVNERTQGAKPTKLGAEIRKLDAETKKALAEATLEIPAKSDEYRAKAAEARAKAAETNSKIDGDDDQGDFYVQSVASAYDPKRYEGMPKVADDNGNVPIQSGEGKTNWNVPIKGAKGSVIVHFRDGNGRYTSGLSEVELNSLGLREQVDGKFSTIKPEFVMYNYNNPKDPHFIARYKLEYVDEATKETKVKYEVRKISPNRFVEGAIKGVVGDNTTGSENKDYKLFMKRYKKLAQTENINGSIMSVIESDNFRPVTSIREKVNNAYD
jgi:hypothetical protein